MITPSASMTVQGGFIQFSGLYALASEWIATEPSALNTSSRSAGASRAPSRPAYSTEQWVTTSAPPRCTHAVVALGPCATGEVLYDRAGPSTKE